MNKLAEIIAKAKEGDEFAQNELVKMVKDNGAMKQINRYLYMNRLIDPDDIQGEFWLGVAIGMQKVAPDIGNPIQFLTYRGICQIKMAMEKIISNGVVYGCPRCGAIGSLRTVYKGKHGVKICPKCGYDKIETEERVLLDEQRPLNTPDRARIYIELDFESLRKLFNENERMIFDLMMGDCKREECQNYLENIAILMGVTSQRINQYLRSIRDKTRRWLNARDA